MSAGIIAGSGVVGRSAWVSVTVLFKTANGSRQLAAPSGSSGGLLVAKAFAELHVGVGSGGGPGRLCRLDASSTVTQAVFYSPKSPLDGEHGGDEMYDGMRCGTSRAKMQAPIASELLVRCGMRAKRSHLSPSRRGGQV
jgi:hypothetical protein